VMRRTGPVDVSQHGYGRANIKRFVKYHVSGEVPKLFRSRFDASSANLTRDESQKPGMDQGRYEEDGRIDSI